MKSSDHPHHEQAQAYWTSEASEDMRHIRGYGRWTRDTEWKAMGMRHTRIVEPYLNRRKYDIVELGVGGGTNIYGLQQYIRTYTGIDLSPDSLKAAAHVAETLGVPFTPHVITISEWFKDLPELKADLFVCTAVIQHFPSLLYFMAMMDWLRDVIRPSGLMLMQTRQAKHPLHAKMKYSKAFSTALAFTPDEFRQLTAELSPFTILTHHHTRGSDFWVLEG